MSANPAAAPGPVLSATNGQPLWLLAELTYRCPLHCVFASSRYSAPSSAAMPMMRSM